MDESAVRYSIRKTVFTDKFRDHPTQIVVLKKLVLNQREQSMFTSISGQKINNPIYPVHAHANQLLSTNSRKSPMLFAKNASPTHPWTDFRAKLHILHVNPGSKFSIQFCQFHVYVPTLSFITSLSSNTSTSSMCFCSGGTTFEARTFYEVICIQLKRATFSIELVKHCKACPKSTRTHAA